ncbi:MAG: DNA methyltransferase [Candidatus Thorarchaeota archaeon]
MMTSCRIRWLRLFCEKADTVWFSFNSRWLLDLAIVAHELRKDGWEFKDCVQTFSFYQHCKTDLGNAHRPLWRFRNPGAGLYPEQAKIPSWRQLHGDKRAKKGGKVPGDTFDFTKLVEKNRRNWHERAIQCGEWVVDHLIPDTHFDFTRVTGNSKQRHNYHPTQLNEGLVKRCIQLSTKPGDWVVDTFGGTGTTLRVCRELGNRDCTLIELVPNYCLHIAAEHGMCLRESGKNARWELID